MLFTKYAVCDSKNSKFIKEQEASELLSSLGIQTPLSKIPLVGSLLFQKHSQVNIRYKMNETVNKFLLKGDTFMPEMHLIQPGVKYSACGPSNKNKERIQKFKDTGDSRYIYQNKLDKACFEHDKAYGHYKDLARRTASDKIFRDKAFNVAKNQKCDRYQSELASMVYKSFDKKAPGSGIKNEIISSKELAEELHKPVIRKFKKRKEHSSYIDNILRDDLADMQLISKFN